MMNEVPKETNLIEFYKINTKVLNVPNVNLTYADFTTKFTWLKTKRRLKILVPLSIKSKVLRIIPILEPSNGMYFKSN